MVFKPADIKTSGRPIEDIKPPKAVDPKIEKSQKEKEVLEAEKIYRRGAVSIRDVIAPASFKVENDYVRVGSKFCRTVFVVTYPRYISVGWFAPVINFSAALDVSMYFYPVESYIILKQLKNKVGVIEAQIIGDSEKGAPRDPIRETALRDIEELRDNLTQGTEKFFQFALYITVYADSKDELDKMTDQIELIFGARLVYTRRVFFQAEQGFNSTMPMCNDEIMVSFNMNSSPCASSFPFMSADLTSDNGILYGINRHNNSLVLFDRFSMQNANMTIFATSGAGKSYTVKLEILRSLMLGTDVIVIDPEMEYKHLSDAVGGTFINISLASESKINPFDLPRPVGQPKVADIIRSAVITIKGLLRLMLGNLTPQEDSIIDRALLETYAKKDINPDSDLSKIEPPILQDFQDILEGMEGSGDLGLRLKKYTAGTFAGLLNSTTNVDMVNKLVVFSVRDLEDELRPMAIYTIVNYIWNVVRSESKRRILVIDEAWWLMQNEDSAKFVFALVKRCRKYYLGVTTITQDVNDFLKSTYGQAILNNSALRFLLKQSPSAIDNVQNTFLLTEGEKYLLLECGVGEGIFFAGAKHAAIKVVASYGEDQIITSDPRQLIEIEEAKRKFADEMGGRGKAEETEKMAEIDIG
ncbi:MAG: Type IV secretory pathway VirB4 components-like protein [Parcubacteria group bacterium Gr01-1014_18]|nr:MAG: Type IV secretory pathway VirB4 components-like protein [Parcubacteria group bacterium Greene0416_36]TSC80034.1 MAG: Type IV secretory pathway VirB4 components-like protein [Parcubacteria group bacterium Gr01-1014_18]TSC98098.1 MAG: Type IV secretory pathway VirB4 components-like protein [Parcubacteria group bacterium Greene1014_20]TSD06614.1 MAG: Type IV secretory pathway VirB4 components-like protein [Parcubacteria group bacterium Greene0714_2]